MNPIITAVSIRMSFILVLWVGLSRSARAQATSLLPLG